MSNEVLIILMWVALIVGLIGLGTHLGFTLMGIAVLAGLIGWEGYTFLAMFPIRIFAIIHNYILVAIPLFVFMGFMLERAGFADDLFAGGELFMGRIRGGMAVMVVIITTILAACTGIVATGVIMAGVLALPPMLRRGYNKGLALGSIAAGGTLGILIPPSIMLIFYASQTGLSVGKLFLAAFPAGFLLSALFIIYIIIITAIRPRMAPKLGEVPERTEYGVSESTLATSAHPRLRAFRAFLPVAFLIAAVLGAIMVGFASPTEAAACGGAGAIVIAATYRKLNFQNLRDASLRTCGMMGMFGAIFIGAMCFTAIFAGLGGRQIVFDLIMGLDLPPLGILLTLLGIVVMLGMFIDWVAILLIILPTMIPISVTIGWDQLWFGMLICVALQTAWLTPPLGYSLFFLRGLNMPGVTMADIAWGAVPFILLQVIGVGLLIAFPQIILFLPGLVFK